MGKVVCVVYKFSRLCKNSFSSFPISVLRIIMFKNSNSLLELM